MVRSVFGKGSQLVSRNTKSAAPKKGSAQSKTASRRKVTSPAANAKKSPRSVESKVERVATAKTLRKADEPRAERVTKQERELEAGGSFRRLRRLSAALSNPALGAKAHATESENTWESNMFASAVP
jgi:hypothetical protein